MRRLLLALFAVALVAACSESSAEPSASSAGSAPPSTTPSSDDTGDAGDTAGSLEVVSSRPDMVTGGNALVRAPSGAALTVDGAPATTEPGPVDGTVLVTDLPDGKAVLAAGGDRVAVVGHPITGPVFSGPHAPLYGCTTDEAGLGAATDEDCSAPTKVDRLTVGDTPATRERGVINRSVYWIVVPDSGWNGRLVYRFGGGCGTSFGQGTPLTTAEDPDLVGAGYAVATATFNTFQVQCNDVLSAETMMMVKERFIEAHGPPDFTIGEGASGGSIQQHLILQNYPGLLDAGAAVLPFPDAMTIAPGVTDCGLLSHYYASGPGAALSPDQRLAISGFGAPGTCTFWEASFLSGVRPGDGCDPAVPPADVYDPDANPDGLRCSLVDANANSLGRDPATGFARRPLDNVGVEYGRQALLDGTLSVDEFLDLNEGIGGYDIDGNPVPARTEADQDALQAAYAKGRVASGGGDLGKAPLIDLNIYTDMAGDIHDRFRAFSLRDRLPEGSSQQIWTRGDTTGTLTGALGNIVTGGGKGPEAVAVLDEWLTTGKPPAEAVDNCLDEDGTRISGPDLYDRPGPCTDRYPVHADPRLAAGAPLRNDILKCRLTDADATAYEGVDFSAEQARRLQGVFPDGVCDWTAKGVGQVPLEGTWLRY